MIGLLRLVADATGVSRLASIAPSHRGTQQGGRGTLRIARAAGSAIERAMLIIDDLSVRVAGRLLIERASVPHPRRFARSDSSAATAAARAPCSTSSPATWAAEHGDIELPSRWRVGRLAQEAPDGPESLIDVVLKADVERSRLLN